jgi:stage II sporulation protein AA (anti-sigma F factor antagonist)
MSDLITGQKDDVLIIFFNIDSIRSGLDVARVSEQLVNLAHSSGDKVLLDFGQLQQMSSMMIGKILSISRECAEHKITLRICNLQPHIKEVFTATGLYKLLKIHETQEDALSAFKKPRWRLW